MCSIEFIKQGFNKWLRSTSKHPPTKERYKVAFDQFRLSTMELRHGVAIDGMVDNKYNVLLDKGNCLARSLYDSPEISVCIASYSKGAVTEKHHHKEPAIEYITVIKGKCNVYLLDGNGVNVIDHYQLNPREKGVINSGVIHIVTFDEQVETDIIVETIPKDQFND